MNLVVMDLPLAFPVITLFSVLMDGETKEYENINWLFNAYGYVIVKRPPQAMSPQKSHFTLYSFRYVKAVDSKIH